MYAVYLDGDVDVGSDVEADADVEVVAEDLDAFGTTKAKGSASGPSGYLIESSSILGINSRMRKGLETTSSMPAARSVAICSLLALAVTAIIGT
jgi:hypothetical protein